MRKIVAFFVLAVFSTVGFGQDLHFSQISQMPLLLNPGATGMMDGVMRASLQHRNQWVGSNGKFNNTMAAFDMNFLKDQGYNKGYLGVGAFFFNDAAGDGNYGKQSGALSFSGAIPMGRGGNHTLSLGLQAGFASTSINGQNLIFESQWNGTTYDPNTLSGEAIVPSYSYSDVSTGLYYTIDGSNSTFAGKTKSKFNLGLAVYHANKPKLRYTIGGTERLNRKFVAHANYVKEVAGSNIRLSADVAQFMQGKNRETIYGGMFGLKLVDNVNYPGGSSYIGLGLHFRTFESIIPSFMVEMRGFRFELSYDATLSYWRKAAGGGSLELSLVYTHFDLGLFKSQKYKKKS
jgi:type IX secretion system PorP/SprF family membrane protein